MKYVIIVAVALVLIGAAFYGGTLYAGATANTAPGAIAGGPSGAPGGGPMGQLSEEDRAKVQSMSEEERQAFFEERFGDQMPADGARGARGGMVEGEVLDVATDSITVKLADGGSATLYTDEDTLVAFAEGAGELAAGAEVLAYTVPEADGVTNASAVIVK